MKYIKRIIFISCLSISTVVGYWGFYGHKLIAEWSVYSLPNEMFSFYKSNANHIISASILPDILKNSVPLEFCRHYIDLDVANDTIENLYFDVDSCLKIETCANRGVLPFIIESEFYELVIAFRNKDPKSILRQSGMLSHYCSDLCVPLHTTENYDGQLTGQKGIHALWESYLVERYTFKYDLYDISAVLETDLDHRILQDLYISNQLVDPLLKAHQNCQKEFENYTHGFYERKGQIKEGYSEVFQECFHDKVSHQIEGQLRRSIQLTSDLWYSAWILADKPNLDSLETPDFIKENAKMPPVLHKNYDKRHHE